MWRAPGADSSAGASADGQASPRVAVLLDRLGEVLDELAELGEVSLCALSGADVTRLLDATTTASSRLTAVQCRIAAEADRRRLGDEVGARHTHHWWADRSGLTRPDAARLTRLGVALATEAHAPVAAALAVGGLRVEQARVIVDAVDALPRCVDPDVRGQAEAVLLDHARQYDARGLRLIGKRILDLVAPEIGEAHEAAALAREEADAVAGVELTLVDDDGHGRCRGWFTGPSHIAKILRRHLLALANPARHTDDDLRDDTGALKPLRRRLGEAFVEYVERYPVEATRRPPASTPPSSSR